MNIDDRQQWIALCDSHGLEPDEVRIVSGRYDMYKSYTKEGKHSVLPLDRWYKWYRIEKLSEGHATIAPPAAGCSIDPAAEARSETVSEAEFLHLLELYRTTTDS